MFYTKPVLTTMRLVSDEALSATPWENFTQGGTILDGAVSSHDALLSGTVLGGGN